MTRSGRKIGAALIACLLAGAFAGFRYWRYAAEHLRDTPKIPACVVAVNRLLRKPEVVSGTEPHDDVDGNTVHLRPNEDRAVRCVSGISRDLARRFTTAFAETEPELRGLELLKIMRDAPPGKEHDVAAHSIYRIAGGAMRALPDLPETKAASDELDLLHACRFTTRRPCPTRPPIPAVVWLLGIPSALGLLVILSVPVRALVARLVERIRNRPERAKTTPATTPGAGSNGTKAAEPGKRKKRKSAAVPDRPTPPSANE